MKRIILIFLIVVTTFILYKVIKATPANDAQPQRFWQITSVDTSKYSRDMAQDQSTLSEIPQLVGEAAKLHVTHIAIDTPYDEQFYPVLKAWVDEARKDHLKVWFRGNFSGWEGWFGFAKTLDASGHNTLTKAFITGHPELFEDGDIFTPVPEPENGGPGDPRESDQKAADFNAFLVSSYNNCVAAFAQINARTQCGFFSTNGDIAKSVITPETVAATGNTIVIDHYVNDPKGMQDELSFLENKFPHAKIILGEFGAPIPDINGDMTEMQQAAFVNQLMQVFYTNRASVLGVDYWTLAGGSTSLLNDDFSERKVFQTIADYYYPSQLQGKITNTVGDGLENVVIRDKNNTDIVAQTLGDGSFSIAGEKQATVVLNIQADGYKPFQEIVTVTQDHQKLQDIKLQPENIDFIYKIRLFIINLLSL